jgi:ppGpp synthetase/RelA/SpoT-type nucleotidyltranferase
VTTLEKSYTDRFIHLQGIANLIEADLKRTLERLPHIDRISARPKSIKSFLNKAAKIENGRPKYSDPINDIQDQVGARIIVFYLEDVEAVTIEIEKYNQHIEKRNVVPDSEKEFGYFGKHFIFMLNKELKPMGVDEDELPAVFELQIKTLFQHAFSEGSHDLAYKPSTRLSKDQQRKVAFTAAQAWGGDKIFQELHDELLGHAAAQ